MTFQKLFWVTVLAGGLIAGPVHAADTSVVPEEKPVAGTASEEKTPYSKVENVFSGSSTIAGEPLVFPSKNPSVKSLIVTMAPGEKTAWHQHGAPLFAYILEGEITVTYDGIGAKTYKKGEGLLEAMHVTHQGHNTGDTPVRILAVFMLGDGNKPTIAEQAPANDN